MSHWRTADELQSGSVRPWRTRVQIVQKFQKESRPRFAKISQLSPSRESGRPRSIKASETQSDGLRNGPKPDMPLTPVIRRFATLINRDAGLGGPKNKSRLRTLRLGAKSRELLVTANWASPRPHDVGECEVIWTMPVLSIVSIFLP